MSLRLIDLNILGLNADTFSSFKMSRCIGSLSSLVVVVALLFYVHGKHLRSCRDGQLT